MDLASIGEFGLIDLIKENTINDKHTIIAGIGDDAAVVKQTPGNHQLLAADMLVEDIHFVLEKITPEQLGYKAVAVNLSDIAAMGGIPRQILVSIAIPKKLSIDYIKRLYDGMKSICKDYGVNIIGGDTVGSKGGLVINVTVVGEGIPANIIYRSGAKPGHIVGVTNTLGDSAAGLDLLLNDLKIDKNISEYLIKAHLTPEPQVRLGQEIALMGASSMDDISDGLASELNELSKASNVGFLIYKEKIPISLAMCKVAEFMDKDWLQYVLYGGEDYQLVFTMEEEKWSHLQTKGLQNITPIGLVTTKEHGIMLEDRNSKEPILANGYNHFR